MKFFLATVTCLFFSLSAFAQRAAVQQAAKASSLFGSVSKDGTGEPVRNAEVSVTRGPQLSQRVAGVEDDSTSDSQSVTVVTDASGRFRFPSLAPGDYTLVVRKNGFHGFRGPNSRSWQEFLPITLSPGQAMTDLVLTLQPGAVITGKVIDENAEAMPYVQLNAMKWVYANHRRQLRPVGTATTDDEGNYRMFGLEPGRYVVRANVVSESGQSATRYAPAYFPDAASPNEASPLLLRPGDQTIADFRLSRVRAVKISGHVGGVSAAGQTQIYLRNNQDDGIAIARSGATSVDRNGSFTLEGVLPGDYVLGVMEFRGDANDNPQHAEIPLRVDGADLANVNLTLEDSGKAILQGTLHVEGGNVGHPRLDSLRVGLLPADDSTANSTFIGNGGYAAVGKDGSIRLDKISPGQYVVSITADGAGWEDFYTKSVQIGSRDVTDSVVNFNASRGTVPISISVGVDGAYVEGTVTDENKKPVANATVIGVPEPALRSQFDLFQRAESDQNGHFRMRGIKPGSYSFYAWNVMEDESYMDPEFLRRFENQRTDLTLAPQEHQTLALPLLSTDYQ